MSVDSNRRHSLLSWVFVVVLVVLCATLGAIQYVWIGQVSRAEHERLQGSLRSNLQRLSEDFNAEIRAASAVFSGDLSTTDDMERESEYATRLARWRSTSRNAGLIRRVASVIPEKGNLVFRNLDMESGALVKAEWPAGWSDLRDRITARVQGVAVRQEFGGPAPDAPLLIDIPHFGRGEFDSPRESGWTIVELDRDYMGSNLIPQLLLRHLGDGDKLDYHVEVVARNSPDTVIYDSDPGNHSRATLHADASVGLFEGGFGPGFIRRGPERGRGGPGNRPPRRGPSFENGRGPGRPPGPPNNGDRGRWILSVQHRAGSLEALVEQSRVRNLAITGGILLLTLAAVGALMQFTRRSHRLSELQMEFVASVSHELRTPLAVIRTASHNLSARLINNPNQVQRYGALIEEQSEKLTDIMDRVLLFSNAKAGRVIHSQEPIGVDLLLEEAVAACAKQIEESRCVVEKTVAPGTPLIFGDPTALKHALLNLICNAAKYGAAGGWIGISAGPAADPKSAMVEIRVSDRGPGIPDSERGQIFDAFYRGKVAVADQIHGTGLGLSLVKRIVQAHGGTVVVRSEPGKLTEFVVTIPAAPAEKLNEFADPVNRG